MNENQVPSVTHAPDNLQRGALSVALGSAGLIPEPPDMLNDPEYQAWVESMAKHCRCKHDCPCAGVLAGGLCDNLTEDEHFSIFDGEDDF